MKKILFALAILPLLIIACSSDQDKSPNNSFDYNIVMLYGEWHATGIEGVTEDAIDLTDPELEELVEPTYVTFKKDGTYLSKGVIGDGTGKYTTKDKTISATVNGDKLIFVMTQLEAKSAKIEVNPQDFDFGIPIPEIFKKVTVVLTKQN